MFHYIQGDITHIEPNLAVVDAAGVGYACHTSLSTLSALKAGQRAKLFTYLHVREDIFDLYGFATQEELSAFKMLLGISGVGPRAALSILSVNTPERLALSVLTGDEKALTAASGVGKKLAQRIVLELKDKVGKQLGGAEAGGFDLSPGAPVGENTVMGEARAALVVLGYSAAEAAHALRGIDTEGLGVEAVIRQALKNMAKL